MEAVTIVAMLALIEYGIFGFVVGMSRAKFDVPAPATTGNADFERVFRAHQNTMEQLVVFIPGIYAFGYFVSELWAVILGVIYIVGRALYFQGYRAEAEKRQLGNLIGFVPVQLLLFGALIGAALDLI